MESQGHGQVAAFDAAFEAKHPRDKDGEFAEKGTGAAGAEATVKATDPLREATDVPGREASVKSLPDNWGSITTTERRNAIAAGLSIPENGMIDISIGDLQEVKLGRTGIRHSLKEYRSIIKDALMMTPNALLTAFRDAHYEKDEPNTKEHVDQTMRYKSKCIVDGKEYVVGFIVHHNKLLNCFMLYHISVYE